MYRLLTRLAQLQTAVGSRRWRPRPTSRVFIYAIGASLRGDWLILTAETMTSLLAVVSVPF